MILPGFPRPMIAGARGPTWSASDKAASVSLSSGRLIASGSEANWRGARATAAKSAGKYLFEVTVSSVGTAAAVGISQAGVSHDNYYGASSQGWSLLSPNGNLVQAGTVQTTFASFTSGDVISVAVDLVNNKVFFAKNGTWLGSSNPSTNTGGNSIVPALWFPGVSLYAGAVLAANFGALPFTVALPAGFKAWREA